MSADVTAAQQMVAGSPMKKTGGGYSQDDLSIFYYCEQDWSEQSLLLQLPRPSCGVAD